MIWLVLSAVAVLVLLLWVVLPLSKGTRGAWDAQVQRRELMARREQFVAQLREAKVDLDVGRIDAATYETLRASLEPELAGVLARLDALETTD